MLRNIVFAFLLLRAGVLPAADLVPDSTSPDGRYALAFVCPEQRAIDKPTVWFVRLPKRTLVSAQLVPHDEPAMRRMHSKGHTYMDYRDGQVGENQDNRDLMFDILTSVARDTLQGKARGEGYRIVWSDDGEQVTVWVAAHKFQHASIYRMHQGKFYRHQDLDSYEPPDWRTPKA